MKNLIPKKTGSQFLKFTFKSFNIFCKSKKKLFLGVIVSFFDSYFK